MTDKGTITHHAGSVSFDGKPAVNMYTAKVLASGLRLYASCGIRPNRAWTPTAMLRKANEITGSKYKRGQYLAAALDLDAWCERQLQSGNIQVIDKGK